jgi:hypothetical protein
MAQLLLAQGCKPEFLGLIFVYLQGSSYIPDSRRRIGYHLNKILTLPPREKAAYLNARVKRVIEKTSRRFFPSVTRQWVRPSQDNAYYYPFYYRGKITLFRPIEGGPPQSNPSLVNDRNMGWTGLAEEIELHEIPGDRARIFQEPNVLVFAERLEACLSALQEKNLQV